MADSITLRDYLPEMFGYTSINLGTPPVLTQAQLVQLEAAKATGSPATIWKTLSGFGDTYAKGADGIISHPTGFHGEVVTSSWIQTGAPLTKFDKVASDYAVSYADQGINRGGILPSTGEIIDGGQRIPGIEQLYRKALEDNQVPVNAAIDSTMWQSVFAFLRREGGH